MKELIPFLAVIIALFIAELFFILKNKKSSRNLFLVNLIFLVIGFVVTYFLATIYQNQLDKTVNIDMGSLILYAVFVILMGLVMPALSIFLYRKTTKNNY